jgi:antitoxin component YwqK of YwqJK toxin-antitoxin module
VGEASLARAAACIALGTLPFASFAQEQQAASPAWKAVGGCRDGQAQGPYQLRSEDGDLRVAGAFNEGTRTGSFIFWREGGVREAHVPYDTGVRNGTVATWYEGPPGREPPRQFESSWRHGVRDGETRSWYASGRPRSKIDYRGGRIVAAQAWREDGTALDAAAARALADRDEQTADAQYARHDALVRDHPPPCAAR